MQIIGIPLNPLPLGATLHLSPSVSQPHGHIENSASVFVTVLGYMESRDEQDLHS